MLAHLHMHMHICKSVLEAMADGPVVQSGGAARPERYEFPSSQSVQWLRQVVQDPRLLRGLEAMCREVQWRRMPYAQMLALNYQLGGRVCFPTPEAGKIAYAHAQIYCHA